MILSKYTKSYLPSQTYETNLPFQIFQINMLKKENQIHKPTLQFQAIVNQIKQRLNQNLTKLRLRLFRYLFQFTQYKH